MTGHVFDSSAHPPSCVMELAVLTLLPCCHSFPPDLTPRSRLTFWPFKLLKK